MRVIIAGSRTMLDYDKVVRAISVSGLNISKVISGGCKGVDLFGERWAKERAIPVQRFDADWEKHGRAAGPIRNVVMAENADALIAIWDGKSRGTKSMIEIARKKGLRIVVC